MTKVVLLSIRTYLEGLKDEQLKNPNFVETFKDSDPDRYKILKGFIANIQRVRTKPEPSELDKRAVATAYYKGKQIAFTST